MCHHESKNKRNSHEAQKKIIWWPVGNAQWIKTRGGHAYAYFQVNQIQSMPFQVGRK